MYDTIIIGAGPAGMTATLYAARSNLKVALIEGWLQEVRWIILLTLKTIRLCQYQWPRIGWKDVEPLENLGVEHLYGFVENVEDHEI